MKVEIISWTSDKGGAARASYQLFKALKNYQKNNLEVKMRVNNCNFKEQGIINPKTNSEIGWNLLRRYLGSNFQKFQKTTNQSFHSSGLLPSLLDKKINNSDSDIINLHWFQGEMLSIRAIGRIKKPIILIEIKIDVIHPSTTIFFKYIFSFNKKSLTIDAIKNVQINQTDIKGESFVLKKLCPII